MKGDAECGKWGWFGAAIKSLEVTGNGTIR